MRTIDLTGQRFGRLVADRTPEQIARQVQWEVFVLVLTIGFGGFCLGVLVTKLGAFG